MFKVNSLNSSFPIILTKYSIAVLLLEWVIRFSQMQFP